MRYVTIALFVACGLVAIALWLTGRRNKLGLRPVGALFDAAMTERAARITLLLFWWWLGWHFLVARTVDG